MAAHITIYALVVGAATPLVNDMAPPTGPRWPRYARASLRPMDRFLVPAAASIVVGLLLGAAAVFGVTLMVQQDNKPPLQAGDPASSVLNRVEYGDRT